MYSVMVPMLIAFLLNQLTPCRVRISSVLESLSVLFFIDRRQRRFPTLRIVVAVFTIVNLPVMSRMVKSAGTAMLIVGREAVERWLSDDRWRPNSLNPNWSYSRIT